MTARGRYWLYGLVCIAWGELVLWLFPWVHPLVVLGIWLTGMWIYDKTNPAPTPPQTKTEESAL